MLKVKIKPVRDNFKIPVKASGEAACFDCYASEIEEQPDGSVFVKLGFETEIPEGWRADLLPRSNITKYPWVLSNSKGIIDSDFRNEWQARFKPIPYLSYVPVEGDGNITEKRYVISNFPYRVGDRVCQIKFEKVNPVEFIIDDNLQDTGRGKGGFGHTGLK